MRVPDQAIKDRTNVVRWTARFDGADNLVQEAQQSQVNAKSAAQRNLDIASGIIECSLARDYVEDDEDIPSITVAAARDPDYVLLLQTRHINQFFSYLIDAAIELYRVDVQIDMPLAVKDETKKALQQQDSLQMFIDKECVLEPVAMVKPQALKQAYTVFCQQTHMSMFSPATVLHRLVTLYNCKIMRPRQNGRRGERVWVGLKLHVPTDAPPVYGGA